MNKLACSAVALWLLASPAAAQETHEVIIEECRDGDTCRGFVELELDLWARWSIRLRGLDTPEIGWRAECLEEAELGIEARDRLWELLSVSTVEAVDLGTGKYAKSVVATLLVDGRDVAEVLIEEELGRPYFGETKEDWCNE